MRQKKLVNSELLLRHYDHDLSKRWCFEWYDKNGKRRKSFEGINDSDNVVERLAAAERLRIRMATGLIAPPKPATSIIFQHLEPNLVRHCELLRETSKKEYTTCLRNFDVWLISQNHKTLHPAKFTKKEANEFCRYLQIEKQHANATYNKYVNTLDMLFNYLVDEDVITKSPFQFIKRKTKQSKSVSAFKAVDVQLLKGVLQETNTTVYISCMVDMYAFIRPKEIRFLRIRDIDLVNDLIYIDKSISKNKKSQHVAILPPLKLILTEYIGVLKEQDYFLLSKTGRPGLVQISSKYVVENHNRILKAKGYDTDKFKPYSWKHTGNSLAFEAGAKIDFLKMQNRHHSVVMTEIYIKSIVAEDLVKGQEQFFNF